MIRIDCKNALAIKDKLLIYVADKLEVIPILKSDKAYLDPIDDSKEIDKTKVLSAIKEFLKSIELEKYFQIIPKGDDIVIEPLEGKDMKEKLSKIVQNKENVFFECPHCGFITLYEVELRTHKMIHYI